MDGEEFRKCGKELVDLITDYLETIRKRPVLPDVQPGYMRELLPDSAPENPEPWQDVIKDIERVVLPGFSICSILLILRLFYPAHCLARTVSWRPYGPDNAGRITCDADQEGVKSYYQGHWWYGKFLMTHWNSPHFHAYFPTANSYPAMCGDILISALSCIGFTWMASPACTEMEMVMMDWLGKMLQLPEHFLFESKGSGGGVIQGTASEATLVALLAARSRTLALMEGAKLEKLVAYASDQSHSSVERAALLGAVQIRLLPTDDHLSLTGDVLARAIREDREKGLIPFIVIATLGTTNTCAFDNLKEIGQVCNEEKIWVHVDAAYAGSSFICPEYRPFLDGVELVDSFNFNPHKWLLVNFDCSAMWVKNQSEITEGFSVNPTYLKHDKEGQIPDYRHWQIPLGRRFRSLKLWFVFRLYGVEGLRDHIRKYVHMAKEFEKFVLSDDRFEIEGEVHLGLVCFRRKGPNSVNEEILKKVNARRKIHITPTIVRGKYILRFAVCSRFTTPADVEYAWREIQLVSSEVLP